MMSQWLQWSRRLQAVAQTGLTYAQDPFDSERYREIRGIAAGIMAAHSHATPQVIENLFAEEMGYATPKLGVRGAVIRERNGEPEVLLVLEKVSNAWTLPGGFVDVGDSPAEAVIREIFEESGYHVCPTRLIAVVDRDKQLPPPPPRPFTLTRLYFLCELLGGEATTSIETSDIGFFCLNNLPPLDTLRTPPNRLQQAFEFYRQPEMPAFFD